MIGESLATKLPDRLKPPLRYLREQYILWHCSEAVKKELRFFKSHFIELEAQISPTFASGLLQAVVDTNHLKGDIIECGTYKGGSTILIAHVLDMIRSTKHIYACDTFEGHPYDDINSAIDRHTAGRSSDTSVSYVRSKFQKFKVSDRITIVKGKFEDTLVSSLGDKTFSLAFVDCNLYHSARSCYSFLYPRIAHRGYIIVHDYVSPNKEKERVWGISLATDEFLGEKGLLIKRVVWHTDAILIP